MSETSPGGWWQIRQPPPARQPCGRITTCPDDQPCQCHGRGHRDGERRGMSDPQLHLLLNRINELTARAEAAEAERDALRGRIEAALDASALLCGYIEYDSQVAAWMTLESALRGTP